MFLIIITLITGACGYQTEKNYDVKREFVLKGGKNPSVYRVQTNNKDNEGTNIEVSVGGLRELTDEEVSKYHGFLKDTDKNKDDSTRLFILDFSMTSKNKKDISLPPAFGIFVKNSKGEYILQGGQTPINEKVKDRYNVKDLGTFIEPLSLDAGKTFSGSVLLFVDTKSYGNTDSVEELYIGTGDDAFWKFKEKEVK